MKTPQRANISKPWMSPDGVEGLVSTIIPAFNRAELITDALDSLWNQDYRPLEIIVVDDGSTDGTADVAEGWASRHSDSTLEVKVIRQANAGVSAARNRGMIECCGEFVQFLDSDDVLMPYKVSLQVKGLQSSDRLYCCGLYLTMDAQGVRRISTDTIYIAQKQGPFYASLAWSVNACLYRRSVLRHAGKWDERFAIAEDALFALKVKLVAGRPLVIPVVTDIYRDTAPMRAMRIDSTERLWWFCRQIEATSMELYRLLVAWRVDTATERWHLVRRLLLNSVRAARLPTNETSLSSLQCAATIATSPSDRLRVIALRALVRVRLLKRCAILVHGLFWPVHNAVQCCRIIRLRYSQLRSDLPEPDEPLAKAPVQ